MSEKNDEGLSSTADGGNGTPAAQSTPAKTGWPKTPSSVPDSREWERDLIAKVALAAVDEQRRARRWSIFFKSLVALYVAGLLLLALPKGSVFPASASGGKHTALVEINGVIAADQAASADTVNESLRAAFKDKNTAAVILSINSPGGSPVQAGYVNDEITRLRGEHPDIKVYAVIADICASGGYYIAVAADKIYADKASLVGSIGVLMDGFGFTEAMNKLGVERRLLTSGESKGFLDPFSPLKESDAAHMRTLLAATHKQFIDVVKKGRGERLKENEPLFSGLIWNGEQALDLGLVDGLGSPSFVARQIVGEEDIVNYTRHPPLLERFAEKIGMAMGHTLTAALNWMNSGMR